MLELKGEFIPTPKLAQSNWHHKAMGSSHRHQPDTPENLHRPDHEFLTDNQLSWRIIEAVFYTREALTEFRNAKDPERKAHLERSFLRLRDNFLFPNLHYLAAIGRLPEGVSVSALEKELQLIQPK